MSSCNVEALTMERFSHASSFSFQWLLLWSLAAVNLSFELLFIWLHLCSPRQFPFPIILGYRRLSVKFLFIIVFYSNYFSILLLIIDSYIWSFPEHLSFSLLIISFTWCSAIGWIIIKSSKNSKSICVSLFFFFHSARLFLLFTFSFISSVINFHTTTIIHINRLSRLPFHNVFKISYFIIPWRFNPITICIYVSNGWISIVWKRAPMES